MDAKNDFYTTEFHQYPTVIEHFSIDLIFPRIILPLVAILFDVICVFRCLWHSLRYISEDIRHSCPILFWPRNEPKYTLIHHTSRMLDVEGTMKRDKLIIDDEGLDATDENIRPMGVIRLSRIKNVYGIHNTHSQVIAGVLIFTAYRGLRWQCSLRTTHFGFLVCFQASSWVFGL